MIKLTLLNGTPMLFNRKQIVGIFSISGGSQVITVNGSYSVRHKLTDLEEFLGVESIHG